VDESDIGRIKPGQRARITVDAYPELTFPGEVVRVATKGVEESSVVTFEVKIEVKGRNRQFLKPEMTADVEVIAVEKDGVLLVPVTAIERSRTDTFVSLYNSNTTVVRQVTIGDSDGEFMEIVEGLKEGDMVSAGSGSMSSRWQMSRDDARNMRRRQRMQMRMMRGGTRR
jgi:multidrug efflux pump subunit AcrA (membrane-fusion protein)